MGGAGLFSITSGSFPSHLSFRPFTQYECPQLSPQNVTICKEKLSMTDALESILLTC